MAYPISTGGLAECVVESRLYGQAVLNTFWWRSTAAITDGRNALSSFADGFEALWEGILTYLSEDFKTLSYRWQWVHPTRYQPFFKSSTAEGSVAGQAVPSQTPVALARRAEEAGRANQGRIFLSGMPSAEMGGNLWTPLAGAAAFRTAWSDIALFEPENVGVVVAEPVIVTPSNLTTAPRRVTSATIDFTSRSQRRRETGRGI